MKTTVCPYCEGDGCCYCDHLGYLYSDEGTLFKKGRRDKRIIISKHLEVKKCPEAQISRRETK